MSINRSEKSGQWRGVFSILCTPFDDDGRLDLASLDREVTFCLAAGVAGVVALANASEYWTLSDDERRVVAERTVIAAGAQVPVVVGITSGSAESSTLLGHLAEEVGADGVMAMPPPARLGTRFDPWGYYERLSNELSLPVVVQNHDAPLGSPMSPETVASLVCELPNVDWIKEETVPAGVAISKELRLAGPKLKGVMGGLAGRFMFDEYRRGACGTMPACESSDVHAAVWRALEAGKENEARELFDRLLPLLNLESASPGVYKTVLQWRGVLKSDYLRSAHGNPLDAYDRLELAAVLRRLSPLFTTSPPRLPADSEI